MLAHIKRDKWVLLAILILSLMPLLWFHEGYLVTGTDLDYPLFPEERLQERLFGWYDKILGGTDRTNNFASLPYYSLPFILSELGFDLLTGQKIVYVFWFFLSGLGMYFLMSMVLNKESWATSARLFAVVLYMVNFYNVFIWTRLQLNVSALFFFPVFLGVLIGCYERKISLGVGMIIIAVSSVVSGSMGIQPPLILVFYSLLMFFCLLEFILSLKSGKYHDFFRFIGYILLFTMVFLFSSAFWALPLLSFILQSGYHDSRVGLEVYSVTALLDWVSSNTSVLNVFRLYGDAPWFDSWDGEKYFPEFMQYLSNPLFIVLSFILPILAFGSLLIKKVNIRLKKYLLFFAFASLLGLWFGKGTHYPLGGVFLWMIDNVPLFWVHRAPWQKFTSITILGYAVLGGVTLGYLSEVISQKYQKVIIPSLTKFVFIFIFLVIWILYNNVFVLGLMFPSSEGNEGYHRKFNLGFHHQFPEYLFEARDFINSSKQQFNIMLLPDDRTNVYTWGYAGAADVTSLLLNKTVLFSQYGEGFAPPQSIDNIYSSVVRQIYIGTNLDISQIMGFLNIRYIFQRNDFVYDFYGDTDSPDFIKNRLKLYESVILKEQFGQWDLYEIDQSHLYPIIYSAVNSIYFLGDTETLPLLIDSFVGEVEHPFVVHSDKQYDAHKHFLSYEVQYVDILSESMQWDSGWAWPNSSVSPASIVYPLVQVKEFMEIKSSRGKEEYLDTKIWFGAKRVAELQIHDNLSVNQRNQVMQRYTSHLEDFIFMAKNVPHTERDEDFWKMVRKGVIYTQRSVETLSNLNVDPDYMRKVVSLYREFQEWYEKRDHSGCEYACVNVLVPLSGNYKLTFLEDDIDSPELAPSGFTVYVGDEVVDTGELDNGTRESFLEKNTTYRIEFDFEDDTTSVFMGDIWEQLNYEKSVDIFKDINELKPILNAYQISVVNYGKFDDLEALSRYRIEFDYFTDAPNIGLVVTETGISAKKLLSFVRFSGSSSYLQDISGARYRECSYVDEEQRCFKKFSIEVDLSANSEFIEVFWFGYDTSKDKLSKSSVHVENLRFVKERKSYVILTHVSKDKKVTQEHNQPQITFYKVNPVMYKVLVEEASTPYFLLLNQNFHNGWKIYLGENEWDVDNPIAFSYFNNNVVELSNSNNYLEKINLMTLMQRKISSARHLVGNGYANLWYIQPEDVGNRDTYTLIIAFWPQKLFYIGAFLSLFTVLGVIVVVGLKKYLC